MAGSQRPGWRCGHPPGTAKRWGGETDAAAGERDLGGYQRKTLFDTRIRSLDARLVRGAADSVTMNVTVNVFTNTARLKAAFERTRP